MNMIDTGGGGSGQQFEISCFYAILSRLIWLHKSRKQYYHWHQLSTLNEYQDISIIFLVVSNMKQIDPGGYKRRRGGEVTIVSSLTKAMFIFLLFVPVCFGQTRERVQFRISGRRKNILLLNQQFVVPCSFNDLKFYPFIKPKCWVTATLSGTLFVIV